MGIKIKNLRHSIIMYTFILLFTVIGLVVLLSTHAAPPAVSREAEANVNIPAMILSDPTTSNGNYVKFGTGVFPVSSITSGTNCTHGQAAPTNFQCRTIISNGVRRYFTQYVPSSVAANQTAPLVMWLHASEQSPANLELMQSFDAVASSHNYVVVYPDGWHPGEITPEGKTVTWHPGSIYPNPPIANTNSTDDMNFLADIISDLNHNQRLVNKNKVYLAGRSAGGLMLHRMACQMSSIFVAGLSISGSQKSTCPSRVTAPASLMELAAESDPLYTGFTNGLGQVTYSSADLMVNTASTNPTTSWATRINCTTHTTSTYVFGGFSASVNKWSACQGGRIIELMHYPGNHNGINSTNSNQIFLNWINANP